MCQVFLIFKENSVILLYVLQGTRNKLKFFYIVLVSNGTMVIYYLFVVKVL